MQFLTFTCWSQHCLTSGESVLPDATLLEEGGHPGRQDHVASDVDEVPVDEEVEPVGPVGNFLKRKDQKHSSFPYFIHMLTN